MAIWWISDKYVHFETLRQCEIGRQNSSRLFEGFTPRNTIAPLSSCHLLAYSLPLEGPPSLPVITYVRQQPLTYDNTNEGKGPSNVKLDLFGSHIIWSNSFKIWVQISLFYSQIFHSLPTSFYCQKFKSFNNIKHPVFPTIRVSRYVKVSGNSKGLSFCLKK